MEETSGKEIPVPAGNPGKSSLRKKILWGIAIIFILALLLLLSTSLLLLGKVRHYPEQPLGLSHFRVMNKIMRQYSKAYRSGRKKGIPVRQFTLKFNEKEADTLIAIGEFYAKKKKSPLEWKADFLGNGMVEICFSRPLGVGKLALNGKILLIPSYANGVLHLKVHAFELGKFSPDPGWIQKDLDKALQKLEQREEYALLREHIESIRVEKGTLFVTVKIHKMTERYGK